MRRIMYLHDHETDLDRASPAPSPSQTSISGPELQFLALTLLACIMVSWWPWGMPYLKSLMVSPTCPVALHGLLTTGTRIAVSGLGPDLDAKWPWSGNNFKCWPCAQPQPAVHGHALDALCLFLFVPFSIHNLTPECFQALNTWFPSSITLWKGDPSCLWGVVLKGIIWKPKLYFHHSFGVSRSCASAHTSGYRSKAIGLIVHKMASHKPSLPDYLSVGCSGGKATGSFWCPFTLHVMVTSISMMSSGVGAKAFLSWTLLKKSLVFERRFCWV